MNTRFFSGWLWGKDEDKERSHSSWIKLIHQEVRKHADDEKNNNSKICDLSQNFATTSTLINKMEWNSEDLL